MAVVPLLPSCAIATATAALAALVASSTLVGAAVEDGLALAGTGLPALGSWNGLALDPVRGRAGAGRVALRLFFEVAADPAPLLRFVATALTSSIDGLDSTGRFGALLVA